LPRRAVGWPSWSRSSRSARSPSSIPVESQGELLVKGKSVPIQVYAVGVDSLVPEGV